MTVATALALAMTHAVAVPAPPAGEAGLQQLQRKPVSDVKREGWRGIMRSVDSAGQVLMTNHDQPQAVILSLQAYRLLTEQAAQAQRDSQAQLDRLTRAFDAELAVLQQPGAGDLLRAAFDAPLQLKGKVIAGRSY
jgi:PHD/YefM family antitoxin component YafN of YafNO toxin-antitoxin module